MTKHEKYMRIAMEYAKIAKQQKEIPVGCVIVKEDEIIGFGFNQRERKHSPISHAEIEAIESACKKIGDWRLDGCTMYVTLEPCPMCAGAVMASRISELIFGAYSNDGAIISKTTLPDKYHTDMKIIGGVLKAECEKLMKEMLQ